MRRSSTLLRGLAVLAGLAGAGIALGMAWQAIATARDRRRYPPPGRMLQVAGTRLHVRDSAPPESAPKDSGSRGGGVKGQRSGRSTAVLESGLAATSLSWSLVAPRLAAMARVLSYDRAGLGWSEPAAAPRGLDQFANELASVLDAARVPGPVVVVAHSFGSLIARAFAVRFPQRVAGLVLVDPVSIDEWAACSPQARARLRLGARLSRRGAILARLGLVRFGLAIAARGGRLLPRLVAHAAAARQGSSLMERLAGEVTRLPAEDLRRVRAHWSRPSGFHAMADTLDALPACAETAAALALPREIPCIILSAATATPAELAEREQWLSSLERGRHVRLPHGGHWLHLEQPQAVVDAVRSLLPTPQDQLFQH